MKLYTVQGARHWREAQTQGVLTGGLTLYHVEPSWRPAYEWMRNEMRLKLGWTSGDYPVWAWEWKCYEKSFVPDSRWGAVGKKMTVVGFEVPDSRVLLSDFMAWHLVLNNDAIIDEDRDYLQAEKVASWQRIFHQDQLGPDWTDGTIQACVDRVFPNEVFFTREFEIVPMEDDDYDDQ